jgi:flagellar basal-body rod protein FlgB
MNPIGDRGLTTIHGWLDGLVSRQGAISDNIANIDTPGYIRREAPFETALQRAIGAGSSNLRTTDPRHMATGGTSRNQLGMQAAQQLTSGRMDQNTVDIDQEMVEMAETQMRFQAASSALNTKLRILRNVINGQ